MYNCTNMSGSPWDKAQQMCVGWGPVWSHWLSFILSKASFHCKPGLKSRWARLRNLCTCALKGDTWQCISINMRFEKAIIFYRPTHNVNVAPDRLESEIGTNTGLSVARKEDGRCWLLIWRQYFWTSFLFSVPSNIPWFGQSQPLPTLKSEPSCLQLDHPEPDPWVIL